MPHSGSIVTRAEAKAAGLKRYFTGKPCKRDHVAQRYTQDGVCLECSALAQKAWAAANPGRRSPSYETNKVRRAETSRAWAKANVERLREWSRQWGRDNADRLKILNKKWRDENQDRVRAYYADDADALRAKAREWNALNADLKLIYGRNYRARKAAAAGVHTKADIDAILLAQKGKCAYCRKPSGRSYQVDHIVALAKGGSNDKRNLQICCASCNNRKRAADPIVFAQRMGMLI